MVYGVHMPNQMIYVSPETEPIWERARERAANQGVSVSKYVTRLVRADAAYGLAGKELTPEQKLVEAERLLSEVRSEMQHR